MELPQIETERVQQELALEDQLLKLLSQVLQDCHAGAVQTHHPPQKVEAAS